ncbi:MAG: hypothetical protein ABWY11_25345, partial [Umezawaea sp.]
SSSHRSAAAQWCLDQGFPEQAAAALGAAAALRGVEDTLDPDVLALRARCVEALGEAGYRAACERGRLEPAAPAAIESR